MADAPRSQLTTQGRLALRFFAGCLLVLVLAQAFNATLTTAAIRRTQFEAAATAARIVSDDWAFRIQDALRFGKPIEQMFGLQEMLASIRVDLPHASDVFVATPDGVVVAGAEGQRAGEITATVRRLLASVPVAASAKDTFRTAAVEGQYLFVTTLRSRRALVAGGLVVTIPQQYVSDAAWDLAGRFLAFLGGMTAIGGLALLAASILAVGRGALAGRSRMQSILVPVVVVLATQAVTSWDAITTFRDAYVSSTLGNADRSTTRLSLDLERLADRGVLPDEIAGLDAPLARMLATIPELGAVRITTADGTLLASAPAATTGSEGDEGPRIEREVRLAGRVVGRVQAELSAAAIAAGVRQRTLDSATVILTSLLFIVEVFVLFGVLFRAGESGADLNAPPAAAPEGQHLLARPAAFMLLFAWALPLSIVPLKMAGFAPDDGPIPRQILLALPISTEMLAALFTALAAGWLTDRRGWQFPFLIGVAVCATGAVLSALAPGAVSYILARGVVGLGYGFAWMGIQGFVFAWSGERTRGQAIANLVAGIFAGHICGSATGAMFTEQVGYSGVFLLSALVGLLPIAFAIVVMRRYFGKPLAEAAVAPAETAVAPEPGRLGLLVRDRSYVALLLLSVVPFSVAQVGLLYYTVPVYLAERGVGQADIGRIMMVYGLCVIYIAPRLGRLVDRFSHKKPFIVTGGLIGGTGLALCFFDASVATLIVSVLFLGLASSLGGPAQSSFALHLPSVQRVGTGRAMGVQRAADKLGQMIGPLLVGALFASFGVSNGLMVTGLYYVGCTLLFALLASEQGTVAPKAS